MMQEFDDLLTKLASYQFHQQLINEYYEGSHKFHTQGTPPPFMQHVDTVIGWPGTAIDVLEERLDFRGWDDQGKYGIGEVYDDNNLGTESGINHLDSLLYGCSFVHVHAGSENEPDILVTVESPTEMTGVWDRRKRRLSSAAQRIKNEDGSESGAYFEPDRTTYLSRSGSVGTWSVVNVDEHRMGRVPVVFFPNRSRGGRRQGRSEITKAVRAYTDIAVRTLVGMEVNREFFSAPQRYVLGAKENAFVDEQGNPIPGWKAIMGHLWGLERDEDWVSEHGGDGMPQVGQFQPAPPGPYLEQIRGISQLLSAEVAIPPTYLGFATDQPPSADAIRALEARLVKRTERRQAANNAGWIEVAQLVGAFKTGAVPARSEFGTLWQDAATPTRAADADRATKLVGSGVLPPNSEVTYDMIGLSATDQKRLKKERERAALLGLMGGGNETGSSAGRSNNGLRVVGGRPVEPGDDGSSG